MTPLTSGKRRLNLEVVAKFWLSETQTEELARVKHADIDVSVDTLYSARTFFSNHWEWFLGSLLGSPFAVMLFAWVRNRIPRKPKRPPAGFRPGF